MELTPAEIDILFSATEGYELLWDAKWECSRREASQVDDEWVRQGKAAVRKLLDHGLVFLHWDDQKGTPVEIPREQALELLAQDKQWLASEDDEPLYLTATDKGEEMLHTSEQIRQYYCSEKFASRYPASEWHPMKQC